MENLNRAVELRNKYSTPFYTIFMITCGILVIMDFVLIATGISFINEMEEFEGSGEGRRR